MPLRSSQMIRSVQSVTPNCDHVCRSRQSRAARCLWRTLGHDVTGKAFFTSSGVTKCGRWLQPCSADRTGWRLDTNIYYRMKCSVSWPTVLRLQWRPTATVRQLRRQPHLAPREQCTECRNVRQGVTKMQAIVHFLAMPNGASGFQPCWPRCLVFRS